MNLTCLKINGISPSDATVLPILALTFLKIRGSHCLTLVGLPPAAAVLELSNSWVRLSSLKRVISSSLNSCRAHCVAKGRWTEPNHQPLRAASWMFEKHGKGDEKRGCRQRCVRPSFPPLCIILAQTSSWHDQPGGALSASTQQPGTESCGAGALTDMMLRTASGCFRSSGGRGTCAGRAGMTCA
jgi:hypothetical protein